MPGARGNRTQRRMLMGTAAHTRPRAVRGRTPNAETPLELVGSGVQPAQAFVWYVRRRAGFQLGKLAHSIDRVIVRLHRISGPKGAPVFRCRIQLVLPQFDTIIVERREQAPRDAFDRAIDVAERAVRRALTRRRRRARRPRSG